MNKYLVKSQTSANIGRYNVVWDIINIRYRHMYKYMYKCTQLYVHI